MTGRELGQASSVIRLGIPGEEEMTDKERMLRVLNASPEGGENAEKPLFSVVEMV